MDQIVVWLNWFVDVCLHLDRYLNLFAAQLGPWLYVVLFTVVFCETGLVVTPFLPGDSLLFAVGALAATKGSPIDVLTVGAVLITAAVVGDAVNYSIGHYVGPKVFTSKDSRFLNKKHLIRTHRFYERHGGKTIILARFMPIIRTFAPFVAGIGDMSYRRFFVFNVTGAILWVTSFLWLGHSFGALESVKKNFTYVILVIVVLSCIPPVIEFLRARNAPDEDAGHSPPGGTRGGTGGAGGRADGRQRFGARDPGVTEPGW